MKPQHIIPALLTALTTTSLLTLGTTPVVAAQEHSDLTLTTFDDTSSSLELISAPHFSFGAVSIQDINRGFVRSYVPGSSELRILDTGREPIYRGWTLTAAATPFATSGFDEHNNPVPVQQFDELGYLEFGATNTENDQFAMTNDILVPTNGDARTVATYSETTAPENPHLIVQQPVVTLHQFGNSLNLQGGETFRSTVTWGLSRSSGRQASL